MKRIHSSALGPRYQAVNEPVLTYVAGSAERAALEQELEAQSSRTIAIPLVIGGKAEMTESRTEVRAPHDHGHLLAKLSHASGAQAQQAVVAATRAHAGWSRWSLQDRSAVFLKAADLLAGPWRQRLNAATMLGQAKTVQQAEIDSACELADFLRFNVQFARG